MKSIFYDKYSKKYLISHYQNTDFKKKSAEPNQHIQSLSIAALLGSSKAREVSKSTETLWVKIADVLTL